MKNLSGLPKSQIDAYRLNEGRKNLMNPFVGCDGGNITANLCVVALEFGGRIKEWREAQYKYYGEDLVPYRDNECVIPDKWKTSPFDIILSKIYLSFFGPEIDSPNYEDCLIKKLYNRDSKIFKLNLFPLPHRQTKNDTYPTYRDLIEDLPNKKDFQKECVQSRFPKILEFINSRDKFKTIICFGIGEDNRKYYYKLFEQKQPNVKNADNISGKVRSETFQYNDKNVLILTFLGVRFGWNDKAIVAFTEFLRKVHK